MVLKNNLLEDDEHSVQNMINNSICSYEAIAEMCHKAEKYDLSKVAIRKIKDRDIRIYMLVDYQYWGEAIEEVKSSSEPSQYIGYLMQKAPVWVKQTKF